MSIKEILSTWNQVECVRFAVWCARRVIHLNPDARVVAAVEAADRWILDPSEDNASAARAAGTFAADAADAAFASYDASSDARYAVSAGHAAYAARHASYAAGHAAGHASYAAHYAAMNLTEHDLLQIYLSETIMNEVDHGTRARTL